MNSVAQIAYAAGIIDGEGCITVERRHKKRADGSRYDSMRVRVIVSNTNLDLINWLADICAFNRSRQLRQLKSTHKPRYEASIESCKAGDFLRAVLPYLVCKKAQAALAIEAQEHLDAARVGRYIRPAVAMAPAEIAWRLHAIEQMRVLNKRGP